MRGLVLFVTLGVAACAPHACRAALIVGPPQPITHRVTVQLIQTALDNGSSPAEVFGDTARRVEIEAAIDKVWAQAGIDIDFLPDVVRFNDTFAYQGNQPPTQIRPITDLGLTTTPGTILGNAALEGDILHPDPSVINIFFVDIVPGWNQKPSNWVTGVAYTGSNGIAQFIGSGTSPEHAAHWVGHEIGHNLGLSHTSSSSENLMNESSRITSQLTASQINTVLQSGGSGFAKPFTGFLDGDYNRDGRVDTADYTLWRDSVGQRGSGLVADANHDNVVDSNDYVAWQERFGFVAASAAGQSSLAHSSPEPAAVVQALTAAAIMFLSRCRSRRPAK